MPYKRIIELINWLSITFTKPACDIKLGIKPFTLSFVVLKGYSLFVLSFQDFLNRFELIKYKVKPDAIVNKPKIENARKSQFPILSLD